MAGKPKKKFMLVEVPPDLYLTLQGELKAQKRTVRDWLIAQMMAYVEASPLWRDYLRGRADARKKQTDGKKPS